MGGPRDKSPRDDATRPALVDPLGGPVISEDSPERLTDEEFDFYLEEEQRITESARALFAAANPRSKRNFGRLDRLGTR